MQNKKQIRNGLAAARTNIFRMAIDKFNPNHNPKQTIAFASFRGGIKLTLALTTNGGGQ